MEYNASPEMVRLQVPALLLDLRVHLLVEKGKRKVLYTIETFAAVSTENRISPFRFSRQLKSANIMVFEIRRKIQIDTDLTNKG